MPLLPRPTSPPTWGGRIYFRNNATAAQANLTANSGSSLYFQNSATAAQANLTVKSGSMVYFQNTSSSGMARLMTDSGGTVDFSGLSSSGTTVGSISGGGSFILGNKWLETGSDQRDTEVSGVISGTGGSLRKVGDGTLTLSGANTYTGGTMVNGGKLRLTGSLNSSITVASGCELSGTGFTSGSLILGPGAIYSVTINPWTSGSRVGLQVGGSVTLNDNLLQYNFLNPPIKYVPQYRYDLLTYGGTASGSFTLPFSANPFYTQDVLHDAANRRYVLLVGWKPLVSVVNSTANQINVARTLDRAWQAGSLPEIIQPLLMMTAPKVQSALGQLAGSEYAAPRRNLGSVVQDFNAGLKTRLHGLDGGDSRPALPVGVADFTGGWGTNYFATAAHVFGRPWQPYFGDWGFKEQAEPGTSLGTSPHFGGIHFTGSKPAPLNFCQANHDSTFLGDSPAVHGLWGSGVFQGNYLKGSNIWGVSGTRWRTNGFQAGFDRLLGKVRLGFSLGYYDSLGNFTQSAAYWRSCGGIGAFYGQYQGGWRRWYFDFGVAYGLFSNYLKRNLTFLAPGNVTAQGDFGSRLIMGFTEAGFDLCREGPLRLQPFAGFFLADLMTSSFTEKGGNPYNLKFYYNTLFFRQFQLGGRLSLRRGVGRWPLGLQLEAAWRHEFGRQELPLGAAFAANPAFKFTSFGAPRAADSLSLSGMGSLGLGGWAEIFGRISYNYDPYQTSLALVAGLMKLW
jgi:autotransporter-associated beta strand protein